MENALRVPWGGKELDKLYRFQKFVRYGLVQMDVFLSKCYCIIKKQEGSKVPSCFFKSMSKACLSFRVN